MPPRFSLTLTDLTSSVNAPLVLYVKRNLEYIDVKSNYVFLSAPPIHVSSNYVFFKGWTWMKRNL